MVSATLLCLPPPFCFFLHVTATPELYPLSLHDALPICTYQPYDGPRRSCEMRARPAMAPEQASQPPSPAPWRSEEHTSELQSLRHLVCRLLLEKKKQTTAHQRPEAHTSGDDGSSVT